MGACAGALIAPAASRAQAQERGSVSEVVVTAQRRSEAAQDVPVAITAFTAETLEAAGVQRAQEIAALTPGMTFQAVGFSAVPFLRGVGAATSQVGQEVAVALYVDDVYFSAVPSAMTSLNNVAAMTVLRGPQGTLFGRNASAGVMQITTRKPGPTPTLDLVLGLGSHKSSDISFYGSIPVTDRIAGDLSVLINDQNKGWGRNVTRNEPVYVDHDQAYRTRWDFQVADETEITASAHYFQVKNNRGFASSGLSPGELGQNERYVNGVLATPGFYDTSQSEYSASRVKMRGASVRVVQGLGDFADLRSITSYNRMNIYGTNDQDYTQVRAVLTIIPGFQETYTQEFQLVSKDDPEARLNWQGGVFLYKDNAGYRNQNVRNFGTQITFLNSEQATKSWAVYAQADYKFTEATILTLGIRYNEDIRKVWAVQQVTRDVGGVQPAVVYAGPKITYPSTTYRINLAHHFSEDLMGYIGYTTGFKSGSYNTQAIQTVPGQPTRLEPVRPEDVKSFEAGIKSILLDRRLRVNVSAFHTDYSDMQVNAFLAPGNRRLLNAEGAKSYGVDLDSEWHPTEALTFTLAAEWLHARYKTFTGAPFYTPTLAPPYGNIISLGDASGNHTIYAPEFTATLGANYRIPLAEGELKLSGNAAYNHGYFFDFQNRLFQPSFTLFSAQAKWTAPGGRYHVALWGRNLSGEKVYATINPGAGGDPTGPREPRMYGVRVGVHY